MPFISPFSDDPTKRRKEKLILVCWPIVAAIIFFGGKMLRWF